MLIIAVGFDFSYFKNTKVHKTTVVVSNGRMDFGIKMISLKQEELMSFVLLQHYVISNNLA